MKLEELKNDFPETPDFIHQMIVNEVQEQVTKKQIVPIQHARRKRWSFRGIALAAACAVMAATITAYAATNGELFSRIWGTLGRNDVKSHDEVVYSEEKCTSYTATFPEHDYEDIDEEKAEELIGKQLSFPEITQDVDGTMLTILSAVRDHNSAVVEFTLEKEGGVDALIYSQFDNEAKGAQASDTSTFWLHFGDSGEHVFVDLEKSTADKLYCYDYMTLDSVSDSIPVEIYVYPCMRGEYFAMSDEELEKPENRVDVSKISIPVSENVQSVNYTNNDGSIVEISPLSIKIDMKTGLGLSEGEPVDPWSCYYVAIHYKDGTNYVVHEHEISGKHTCDVEIDNSSYACASLNDQLTYVFNRLVDVDEISSITINNVEYTCK